MTGSPKRAQARVRRPAAGAGLPVPHALPGWVWPLRIALLALLVRVIYLFESSGNPFRAYLDLDPEAIHTWARTILGGQWVGSEAFSQAPLYAYVLATWYAVLGPDPVRVLWVQALLGAGTVFLGAWVSGRCWNQTAAIATGLLLAFYLPSIFYTGVLLVPVLATFLLACGLALTPWPLLAGITVGLAGLAHPTVLPGGLVAVIGLMHFAPVRPPRRWLLPLLLGTVIGMAPATVHNLIASGRFVPISANAGINLFIGNGPQANGFYAAPTGMRAASDLVGVAEASRRAGRPLSSVAASRYWTTQAIDAVRQHPGRALLLYLRKFYASLNAYEVPQVESLGFERRYSHMLRVPLLPGWLVLLALSAVALALRRRDRVVHTMVGAMLVMEAVIALFFVTARFRMPAHLFLALSAGAGISALIPAAIERPPGGERRRRWRSAGLAACLVILVFGPNWLRVGQAETFGQYHYRLGVIAEREERIDDAEAAYEAALAADPQLAHANINLGILRARRGDLSRAAQLLHRGIARDPQSARGLLALGQIQQIEKNLAAACSLYARAWNADTTFVTALEFLATAAYVRGDTLAAEQAAAGVVRRVGAQAPRAARCRFILARMQERRHHRWPAWTTRERAAGDLAFAVGDLRAARTHYEAASRADGSDLGALLELVRVATASGSAPEAEQWSRGYLMRGGLPDLLPAAQRPPTDSH